ncbi:MULTISPECIES: SusD/RagB family nutrient-binding outer membrane lipoprotein [unclassified Carboxylicivirga]|uniref:SusD/RagB family nutrient-binding outer membrane lipoprotein n=1 Tax=Carboxylicivirga TaxID=1628153 RepID=UPI003D34C164
MRKNIFYFLIMMVLLVVACSEDTMDEIGTNPNSPTDVPTKLLISQSTVATAFDVLGTDLAWYSSVFCEHTTGVHGQLETADKRTGINSTIGNNSWNSLYSTVLNDLRIVIEAGSEGSEAGNWTTVGIAKVLSALNYSVATDLWGEVPMKEALAGSENRTPMFDSQEVVYDSLFVLLDEAIADLRKESIGTPGASDFYYGGDADAWIKAAYALKARLYNRKSNIDATGSADDALAAINNAFESADDNMVFDSFTTDATGEHPWYQESNDRSHHAISETLFDLMDGLNDPRIDLWFGTVGGEYVPAPNGSAATDQSGDIYSRASGDYLKATSPLPIITFDELKFIEAEANLRLNQATEAYSAYLEAVKEALIRAGVEEDERTAYLELSTVSPGSDNLTLNHIMEQKYISLWLFQSIEAYNDYRRTRIPTMQNSISAPPERIPYANDEVSSNPNVPDRNSASKVWWAK